MLPVIVGIAIALLAVVAWWHFRREVGTVTATLLVAGGTFALFLIALGIRELQGDQRLKFVQVSTGVRIVCGITVDRTVACLGDSELAYDLTHGRPDGVFDAVAVSRQSACALAGAGEVSCWGPDTETPFWHPPAQERFAAIEAGDQYFCGITLSATISCWGWGTTLERLGPPPSATFVAVAPGEENFACAIATDAWIVCWGAVSGDWTPPAGSFKSVSVATEHACAVRVEGPVICWRERKQEAMNPDPPSYASPPEGEFEMVSTDGQMTCGLRPDGSLACWGSRVGPSVSSKETTFAAMPESGEYIALSVDEDFACAIRTDNEIVCWGYNIGDDTW